MRRIARWAAAVAAAAALAVGSATGATGATGAVRLSRADNQLFGVGCPSVTSCLAVGANYAGAAAPLAETWSELGWRVIAVKLPGGSSQGELDGVSCPAVKSGTDCVAVGEYSGPEGMSYALADTWNGRAWTPVKASGSPGTVLSSVSCRSADFCLAVGSYQAPAGTGQPIADIWNGKRWTQVEVPAPAHEAVSLFDSVSCASPSSCVAAGDAATTLTASTTALIGEWNGTRWAYDTSASVKGLSDVDLEGVSCPTAKDCVAVGYGRLAKGGSASLVEAWNGTSWARTSAIAWPKGSTNPWLTGLSCYAAGHCLTAGFIDWATYTANDENAGRAAAARWNGTSWASTPVPGPGPGKATSFDAVTCNSATFCVAVGLAALFGAAEGDGNALSGFWNGTSWRLVGAQ